MRILDGRHPTRRPQEDRIGYLFLRFLKKKFSILSADYRPGFLNCQDEQDENGLFKLSKRFVAKNSELPAEACMGIVGILLILYFS